MSPSSSLAYAPPMGISWSKCLQPGVRTDVMLGLVVCAVTAAALAADLPARGTVPLDVAGALLAPALGGLMLARRRFPAAVLVGSSTVLLGYYALGYPPVGLALPLAGAFFSAAEAGRMRWVAGTAFAVLVISYGYRVAVGQDLAILFGYDLVLTLVVLGGAIAAGDAVRSRRSLRVQARERAALELVRRAQEARQAVEQERGRLARDIHDTLAHTMTVISLHSDVAIEALPDAPGAAIEALENVRAASRDAISELRGSLCLLRGEAGTDRHPVGGLGDLPVLADRARASGLPVTLDVQGGRTLPVQIESTVYRITQEALTNTIRHARATSAEVRVRCYPDRVELQVCDDGDDAGPIVSGHGLTGMRERAALLGGTVRVEPLRPHGVSVCAVLPLDRTVP